jgi:beta-glucosidase
MSRRLNILIPAILFVLMFSAAFPRSLTSESNAGTPAYKDPSLPVESRVADLLGRMTLEEKVAQTHTLWTQKVRILDEQGNFAPQKAREVLKHGIGQIARISEPKVVRPGTTPGELSYEYDRTGKISTEEFIRRSVELANAAQRFLVEQTRLGIPAVVHEEGLHGFAAPGGTHFPQAIALASAWDEELMERVFTVAAAEIRARGGHQALTPVLDVSRDPRWGRTEETYGEDPYLAARLGVAAIRGFQGRDAGRIGPERVVATAKHFAVHGQPEAGTNVGPGNYSERVVREFFLPSFEAAIREAGALSVMPSYNEIDGVPAHANAWLLEQVLRREWGFRGYAVSDYFAIEDLRRLHHVVENKEEAAKKALETGVDIELPDVDCYGTLAELVRQGRISEAVLDRAVARMLRVKFMLGLFENPYVDAEKALRVTNSAESQALAVEAARKSIVLLKNENRTLPLDRAKTRTLAVIGPNAAGCHLGGYSEDPGRCVTILDGIKSKAGANTKVVYSEGVRITEDQADWRDWYLDPVTPPDPAKNAARIAEAVKVARASDAVVLVLGENEQTNREAWAPTHLGDRDSLELLGNQDDLVKAVVALGKPTVVLLLGGRPLAIKYVAENVPAILQGWYLGQEGGTAAAEVIFGEYNPGGKLPITFPRSVGQIPAYYNQKPSARRGYLFADKSPLFAFGHGLSYTTFRYSNLRLSQSPIGRAGRTSVLVDVTNTGKVKGDEVVQMYVRDRVSSVTRPVKELRGFKRVTLEPGETRTVELAITPASLWFYNDRMERVVEPGQFDVMVGGNSVDLETVELEVK